MKDYLIIVTVRNHYQIKSILRKPYNINNFNTSDQKFTTLMEISIKFIEHNIALVILFNGTINQK